MGIRASDKPLQRTALTDHLSGSLEQAPLGRTDEGQVQKAVVTGCGREGQATADRLVMAVSAYNKGSGTELRLEFSQEDRRFLLHNSSTMASEKLDALLSGLDCRGWYPFNAGRLLSGDFAIGLSPFPPRAPGDGSGLKHAASSFGGRALSQVVGPANNPRVHHAMLPSGTKNATLGRFRFKGWEKPTSGKERVIINGFGTSGQETADRLVSAVRAYNDGSKGGLEVTYSEKEKRFTIENSRDLSDGVLAQLLSGIEATGWYPVAAGRDDNGNAKVALTGRNPRRPPEVGKRIVDGAEVVGGPRSTPRMTRAEWVPQGGAVEAVRGTRDFLATLGLEGCIGLTLFNEKSGTGVLAHFDRAEKVNGLESALRRLSVREGGFKAHVVGGDESDPSDKTFAAVMAMLQKHNVSVAETNIGEHSSRPSAIALDLTTGEVTDASRQVGLCPQVLVTQSYASLVSDRLAFRKVT